ncbi:hypothetical protein B0H11DRAFT_1745198 [Mycena galericulata]|nr:hypothetical protein B0H11DRAFT_1745198 [Mycena galericulata]
MSSYTYSTHALPSPTTHASPPPTLHALTERYKTIRLDALLTSPNAFGSTHAIESGFTQQEWRDKVWRPDAVVLVCLARPATAKAVEDLLLDAETEWVGSAILRGPIPASEFTLPPESGAPACGADGVENKWQMTGVFVSEAHRGRGLGKMLIQAAKDCTRRIGPSRLRVMIRPDNTSVLGLYTTMGFVDAGRGTGEEAYIMNGDQGIWDLKFQTLSEEEKIGWTTMRVGILLEWAGAPQH